MGLFTQLTNQSEDDALSDEGILNVFRRSNVPLLKTAEVAEELPIGQYWTNKRLQELEAQGRVHSKSAGQGNVWSLDEAEPTFPIREGIGDILWYILQMKQASSTVLWIAFGLFGVAGIFALILFISYLDANFFFQFYSQDSVVGIMWSAAILRLLFSLVGGLLRLIALGVPRVISQ